MTRTRRNPLDAAHVVVGPFSVEPQEFWTECECPENLCQHLPDRMRPYYGWIVWDTEAGDHAWLTRGSAFQDMYETRRDAIAAARHSLGS